MTIRFKIKLIENNETSTVFIEEGDVRLLFSNRHINMDKVLQLAKSTTGSDEVEIKVTNSMYIIVINS